jgi:hypothetical protein
MRALNIVGVRDFIASRRSRYRTRREPSIIEDVPSKAGQKLMLSGLFGYHERHSDGIEKSKKLARRFLDREVGGRSYGREGSNLASLKQVSLTNP